MSFGTSLRNLRKEQELTLEQLADKLNSIDQKNRKGFTKGRMSKWENDKDEPRLASVKLIADFFNVSVDYFYESNTLLNKAYKTVRSLSEPRQQRVYEFATKQLNEQNSKIHYMGDLSHEVTIDVLGAVSAGTGEFLGYGKTEQVTIEGPIPHYDFAVRVNGDSMQPTFDNGQVIFVNKVEKIDEIRNNQFVIAEINGEAFIKKLFVSFNNIKLISLNRNYEDIVIHDYDDYKIIGVVVI